MSFILPRLNSLAPRKSRRYKYVGRLEGLQSPIIDLAFSGDGRFLASASMEGVALWCPSDLKPLKMPHQENTKLATTLAWSSGSHALRETLCIGTQAGALVIWREDELEGFKCIFDRRIGSGSELVCLATDATSSLMRIAVGTKDRVVSVWNLRDWDNVENVFSVQLSTTMAATLVFHPSEDSVIVFGLDDGKMHTLDASNGEVIDSVKASTIIAGCGAVSFKRGQWAVDNTIDGFDLYDLDTKKFLRTLCTGRDRRRAPKQVAFSEDSRVVVGGSDHGVAYVFDRKTGEVLDKLHHASHGLLRAISVCEVDGVSMIATGLAVGFGGDDIQVWTYAGVRGKRKVRTAHDWEYWILRILLLLCTSVIMSTYLDTQHAMKWRRVQSFSSDAQGSTSWMEGMISLVLSYSKMEVQENSERADKVAQGKHHGTKVSPILRPSDAVVGEDVIYL